MELEPMKRPECCYCGSWRTFFDESKRTWGCNDCGKEDVEEWELGDWPIVGKEIGD
jgi:hypothetical protein